METFIKNEYIDKLIINEMFVNYIINNEVNEIRKFGGKLNLIVNSNVNKIDLADGVYNIEINSYVKEIKMNGGGMNLKILDEGKVDKIYLIGGRKDIEIQSEINDLEIFGGESKIKANYEHSKINGIIKTTGGIRYIFLNDRTKNCKQEHYGGQYHINICDAPKDNKQKKKNIENKIIDDLFKLDENKKDCSICLETFKKGDKISITKCNHIFHKNCINVWFINKKICPLCKNNL